MSDTNTYHIQYYTRPVSQKEFETLSPEERLEITKRASIELPNTKKQYTNGDWIRKHFEMFHPNTQVFSISSL